MKSTWAAVPCVLALCACVRSTLHDEDGWSEIRTEHLLVSTNLDAATAQAAVETLERVNVGMLQHWWPGAETHRPLHIVLLANAGDMREFAVPNVPGYYTRAAGSNGNLVVTSAGDLQTATRFNAQITLKHELTHHLLVSVMRQVPLWVNEGFATYMEGFEISPDRELFLVGKPSPWRLHDLVVGVRGIGGTFQGNLTDWLASDVDRLLKETRYADPYFEDRAWQMFFHLANSHAEELDAYLRLLWTGEPNPTATAQAFKALPADLLARELTSRYRTGSLKYSFKEFPLPKLTAPPLARRMTRAEMHAQLAELQFVSSGSPRRGEHEAREALATDPTNVKALTVLADIGIRDDSFVANCRTAVEAHPADLPALLLLAQALRGPERAKERHSLLERAVRIAPDDPDILNALAKEQVSGGDGRAALAIAQKAFELSPDRGDLLDTLAAALAQSGRCAEALDAQRRAVALVSNGGNAGFKKRLVAYEGGCKSVPLE